MTSIFKNIQISYPKQSHLSFSLFTSKLAISTGLLIMAYQTSSQLLQNQSLKQSIYFVINTSSSLNKASLLIITASIIAIFIIKYLIQNSPEEQLQKHRNLQYEHDHPENHAKPQDKLNEQFMITEKLLKQKKDEMLKQIDKESSSNENLSVQLRDTELKLMNLRNQNDRLKKKNYY